MGRKKNRPISDRVDPIDRLIDWQKRSIWRAHQLESTRRQVKLADTGRSFNRVEDMFIDAIDRKYNSQARLDLLLLDYFIEGYSVRDMESLVNVNRSKIWRSLTRTVNQLEDGTMLIEDL